jgi:hypothetical protein
MCILGANVIKVKVLIFSVMSANIHWKFCMNIKVKGSLFLIQYYTIKTYGEWSYSSKHSSLWHWIEMSDDRRPREMPPHWIGGSVAYRASLVAVAHRITSAHVGSLTPVSKSYHNHYIYCATPSPEHCVSPNILFWIHLIHR